MSPFCMPASGDWNGDLVVFAHGYVAFNEPLSIPDDQMELPGGMSMAEIANLLHFAFAWYNVFATNDGIAKLGGQALDNHRRFHFGSDNDWRLNRDVERFRADRTALREIEAHYQTSGDLDVPLVTLHNTRDPFVPYWHEPFYRWKAFLKGSSLMHSNIPAFRYGHCNFSLVGGVAAFGVLYFKVTGQKLLGVETILLKGAHERPEMKPWQRQAVLIRITTREWVALVLLACWYNLKMRSETIAGRGGGSPFYLKRCDAVASSAPPSGVGATL